MSWVLAPRDRRCGQCKTAIPKGTPMREVELQQVTRRLVRCKGCAGEPVPTIDALPVVTEVKPLRLPAWAGVSELARTWQPPLLKVSQPPGAPVMTGADRGARLAFDGKAAGANEREPGEEG